MVIVEYCKYGNLSSYLRSKRDVFMLNRVGAMYTHTHRYLPSSHSTVSYTNISLCSCSSLSGSPAVFCCSMHCCVFTGSLIWLHCVRVYFKVFFFFFQRPVLISFWKASRSIYHKHFAEWQFFTSGLVLSPLPTVPPWKRPLSTLHTEPTNIIYLK